MNPLAGRILAIVVVVILGIGTFLGLRYAGMFETVSVEEKDAGPHAFLVEEMGNRKRIGRKFKYPDFSALRKKGVKLNSTVSVVDLEFAEDGDGAVEIGWGWLVAAKDADKVAGHKGDFGLKRFPRQRCLVAKLLCRNSLAYNLGNTRVKEALWARSTEMGVTPGEAIIIQKRGGNQGYGILALMPIPED